MIRRLRTLSLTITLGVVLATGAVLPASAAFSPNLIMDDTVFSVSSMSAAQIDSFLNGFSSSCISTNNGFAAPDPTGYSPSGGYTYGGDVSAGQAIYDTAQAYDLNPQVLLVMMQKEEGLVSGGNGCSVSRVSEATAYGCPDSGTTYNYSGFELYSLHGTAVTAVTGSCVNTSAKVGFSRQLIHTAWDLKFSQERSEGNTSWAIIRGSWNNSDDLTSCYYGPMTQGTFARCPGGSTTYYDGSYTTLDGNSITLDTGATAAFYWYTPHISGNQSFYNTFTSWFGGTISANYYQCHNTSNISGAATGETLIPNRLAPGQPQNLSLVVPNNTGSNCIEVHTWANSGLQTWAQHIATNSGAIDPANSEIISADLTGSGHDQLYLIALDHTGSGMIEVHGWDTSDQHWTSHIATNMPGVNPANAEVIAGDPTGVGHDSLFLVEYNGTGSGDVEIHQWSKNFQQWVGHIATNMPAIANPANVQVIAAGLNGDGRDEFAVIVYNNTGSGRIEVHEWAPGEQQWQAHIATNSAVISHTSNDVIAADLNNSGRDELYLVEFVGTGSSMVEVHGWAPGEQQWQAHIATSAGDFSS